MENKMDLKKGKENNTTFLELWNNFKGSCTMHGVGHMSFTLRFRWYVNIFLNLILFKIEKKKEIFKAMYAVLNAVFAMLETRPNILV